MDRELLRGHEFDFPCIDWDGAVAVLSSAGYGPVPLSSLSRHEVETYAIESLSSRSPIADVRMADRKRRGDLSFWVGLSARGLLLRLAALVWSLPTCLHSFRQNGGISSSATAPIGPGPARTAMSVRRDGRDRLAGHRCQRRRLARPSGVLRTTLHGNCPANPAATNRPYRHLQSARYRPDSGPTQVAN